MYHQPTHGRNTKVNILRSIVLFLLLAALYAGVPVQSIASTLLPNGKQTFTNANGTPLAAGKVYFYVPGTTTPKNTYQDSGNSVANANPVVLDSAGRAVIYGTGCYRQIVQTSASVTIWDQTTCDTSSTEASWGGLAGGTPNAIIVSADNFTGADGQVIRFIAAANNSGPTTINPSSFGAVSIVVDGGSGPIVCSGGEIVQNNVITLVYDANTGVFHLSTLTSVTAGAGLSTSGVGSSGGTGATAVTLTSVQPVNAQTGTTYTLLNTDNAKLVTFSNTSGVTVTLPTATGSFGAGYWLDVLNLNTGVVTLLPATGTINGAASAVMSLNGHGRLVSNGANWFLAGGATGASASAIGYSNLRIGNATGVENTHANITASYIALRSTSGFSFAVTSVNVTCNFTINGANGLDTGALANSTWYFLWVISNGTTTACLGSTSSTAPTMPSGYVFKTRVGAIPTDGSSNFYRIQQVQNKGSYKLTAGTNTLVPLTVASGVVGTYGSLSPTLAASTVRGNGFCSPSTAMTVQLAASSVWKNGSAANVLVAPSTAWGGANNGPTGSNGMVYPFLAATTSARNNAFEIALEADTVGIASDAAGGAVLCMGWTDTLP